MGRGVREVRLRQLLGLLTQVFKPRELHKGPTAFRIFGAPFPGEALVIGARPIPTLPERVPLTMQLAIDTPSFAIGRRISQDILAFREQGFQLVQDGARQQHSVHRITAALGLGRSLRVLDCWSRVVASNPLERLQHGLQNWTADVLLCVLALLVCVAQQEVVDIMPLAVDLLGRDHGNHVPHALSKLNVRTHLPVPHVSVVNEERFQSDFHSQACTGLIGEVVGVRLALIKQVLGLRSASVFDEEVVRGTHVGKTYDKLFRVLVVTILADFLHCPLSLSDSCWPSQNEEPSWKSWSYRSSLEVTDHFRLFIRFPNLVREDEMRKLCHTSLR
mmetsp:Transcript_60126/g.159977  ORF Transcript_60126/g.159977 Transcript_60126/m.159977 type:complete len:332 (+) Transcript_60126:2009-3004(+)